MMPYGQVKVYRQRQSSGPTDDISDEETTAKVSAIVTKPSPSHSKKRKAPAGEKTPSKIQNRSATAVSAPKSEACLQGLDTTTDAQTNLARASDPLPYSFLECQIFKRLTDVPADFPLHLSPLITHSGPKSKSPDEPTNDYRYFCPECQKCFTQTHNVASHFSRAHGKRYSKNDRNRTVFCRATVTQSRVTIGAKPIDQTILPRLLQIRQQRSQLTPPKAGFEVPLSNTDRDGQKDAPLCLRKDEAVPASFLVNTIEAVISGQPKLAVAFPTAPERPQRALPPRQYSERIQRMQAVRRGILSRTNAPALAAVSRCDERSEDPLAETTTDTLRSTIGDDHRERGEGIGTTSYRHGTNDFVRQPSWHDIGQSTPGQNSHKRKRTASIATNTNREDRSSEDAEKPRSPSDIEGFGMKDPEGTAITQTTKAAEAQLGGGIGPKESSRHVADSGSQSEQTGQVWGQDEQKEDVEVLRAPEKRRKMTLAEYTALGRGIGAQP